MDFLFDKRGNKLFACPKCGYVNNDTIYEDGSFWEKGCNEHDEEVFLCSGCQNVGPIIPATVDGMQQTIDRLFCENYERENKAP